MTVSRSILVAFWLGLQIWYWTALRTVLVLLERQANLRKEDQIKWQAWLRNDRRYNSWWQHVISSGIVFPARGITLLLLCTIQLIIVSICSPLRSCHRVDGSRRGVELKVSWWRHLIRNIICAITWAELRCLGLTRTEEYEVLNSNFDDIRIEEAKRKIRTRRLLRVDCSAPDEPRSYVANHVSFIDIVLFIALLYPSFCSKASVASLPMIGETAKWLDCIFTLRSDVAERNRVHREIEARQIRIWRAAACFRNLENERLVRLVDYRRAITDEGSKSVTREVGAPPGSSAATTRCTTSSDEEQGKPPLRMKFNDEISYENTSALLVFPEGTTSNGKYLLPFKPGAFTSLMPVSPIVLVYDCPWFNMSYEVVPIVWLFPLLAGSFRGCKARVYWLREMHPTVQQVAERNVGGYIRKVREAMGKVLVAVSNNLPDVVDETLNERWTGDLKTKRECIKHLYT